MGYFLAFIFCFFGIGVSFWHADVCVCVCVFIKLHITAQCVCVCVCVVIPFILDVRLLDVPAGVTGGRSHRISPPSLCGACLYFF